MQEIVKLLAIQFPLTARIVPKRNDELTTLTIAFIASMELIIRALGIQTTHVIMQFNQLYRLIWNQLQHGLHRAPVFMFACFRTPYSFNIITLVKFYMLLNAEYRTILYVQKLHLIRLFPVACSLWWNCDGSKDYVWKIWRGLRCEFCSKRSSRSSLPTRPGWTVLPKVTGMLIILTLFRFWFLIYIYIY